MGLVFQTKAFLWGFLLGWIVSRLLPDEGLGHGVAGAVMSLSAELSSRLRHRLSRVA